MTIALLILVSEAINIQINAKYEIACIMLFKNKTII